MSVTNRFPTVPPAVVPANDGDARVRASRTRQSTFERGVALAIVASMQEQVVRLQTLKEGLRWLVQEEDMQDVKRWLETLQGDILRAERIQERADHE